MELLRIEEVLRRRELSNISLNFHAVTIVRFIVASAAWTAKENGAIRFLEVGSGPGWGLESLCKTLPDSKILAVEVNENSIAELREKLGDKIEFIEHNLSVNALDIEPVDFAAATFVLDHIPPASLAAFCRNLFKLIRPGGTLVVAYQHHQLFQMTHQVSLLSDGYFEIPNSNRVGGGKLYFINPLNDAGFELTSATDIYGNSTGMAQVELRTLIFRRPQ